MFAFIYSILYFFLILPMFLFALLRKKSNKPYIGKRWPELFGISKAKIPKDLIWIHSVSVGESNLSIRLIKEIKKENRKLQFLVTTTTATGFESFKKENLEGVFHQYLPLDLPFFIRLFLKRFQPSMFINIETELWPNLIRLSYEQKIPIIVINARLSERSMMRYLKASKIVYNLIFKYITHISCINLKDRDRFSKLSIPGDKLSVSGSMKYDINLKNIPIKHSLLQKFNKDKMFIVAASTHSPEEELILNIFQSIKKRLPQTALIIIPRHPERFDQVEKYCQLSKFSFIKRSELNNEILTDPDIILVDSMGEMFTFLKKADVVFMGGSFAGDKTGGHNLLEPAILSKATITGPNNRNFQDIYNSLKDNNAIITARTKEELQNEVLNLLENESLRKVLGNNASETVQKNQGATLKTIELLKKHTHNL
ncbi:3-deoxy-D-manno-octulosonic acid transferase [Paraphotobacterium marinum]|uniref:3-deoxy-D-manno-octulosonic acid transferase n=1 Tax=Paraphotobacterium marinum TaxID=1755811 RepID=A0A220VCD7_9GAMM|nr:3-deoxy-D-manno-octulosonic acid transferase [Paraphotobacterium marinum]ASK78054.1 3-deoxy-D-manno-octulosonic acid transferase [Paraphotobacterium marinum]